MKVSVARIKEKISEGVIKLRDQEEYFEVFKAVNGVFKRLNNLRRWTAFQTSGNYNELAKQSLNMVITYMLAAYAEHDGKVIQWTKFPKLAIYRAFEKAYVYFDTPEHIIDQLCEKSDVDKKHFKEATNEIIGEQTNKKFVAFLNEATDSYESRIYKAATKIATLVELEANKFRMDQTAYCSTLRELLIAIDSYKDIPGVDEMSDVKGSVFKVLSKISKLRNQNRWAVTCYSVKCSVLGHLFDTGIFAYLMSLELNPKDEQLATDIFFMGIYHDIAETWTTDVPSPIKDRVKGLREGTEKFELHMIEQKLYSQVPEFLKGKIQKAMFEDEINAVHKRLIKGADYLSADSECWRQYVAGSREFEFIRAISRNSDHIRDGKIIMSEAGIRLHKYLLRYAEAVTKDIPE